MPISCSALGWIVGQSSGDVSWAESKKMDTRQLCASLQGVARDAAITYEIKLFRNNLQIFSVLFHT